MFSHTQSPFKVKGWAVVAAAFVSRVCYVIIYNYQNSLALLSFENKCECIIMVWYLFFYCLWNILASMTVYSHLIFHLFPCLVSETLPFSSVPSLCLSGVYELHQSSTCTFTRAHWHTPTTLPHTSADLFFISHKAFGVRQPGTRQLFKPSGRYTTGQKQRGLVREWVRQRAADYPLINWCVNS